MSREWDWDEFSHEVQLNIFLFCHWRDLGRCARVCKGWNDTTSDDYLWRLRYKSEFVMAQTEIKAVNNTWKSLYLNRVFCRFGGNYATWRLSTSKDLKQMSNNVLLVHNGSMPVVIELETARQLPWSTDGKAMLDEQQDLILLEVEGTSRSCSVYTIHEEKLGVLYETVNDNGVKMHSVNGEQGWTGGNAKIKMGVASCRARKEDTHGVGVWEHKTNTRAIVEFENYGTFDVDPQHVAYCTDKELVVVDWSTKNVVMSIATRLYSFTGHVDLYLFGDFVLVTQKKAGQDTYFRGFQISSSSLVYEFGIGGENTVSVSGPNAVCGSTLVDIPSGTRCSKLRLGDLYVSSSSVVGASSGAFKVANVQNTLANQSAEVQCHVVCSKVSTSPNCVVSGPRVVTNDAELKLWMFALPSGEMSTEAEAELRSLLQLPDDVLDSSDVSTRCVAAVPNVRTMVTLTDIVLDTVVLAGANKVRQRALVVLCGRLQGGMPRFNGSIDNKPAEHPGVEAENLVEITERTALGSYVTFRRCLFALLVKRLETFNNATGAQGFALFVCELYKRGGLVEKEDIKLVSKKLRCKGSAGKQAQQLMVEELKGMGVYFDLTGKKPKEQGLAGEKPTDNCAIS